MGPSTDPDTAAFVPGPEPGTFRDTGTGAIYALPSSFAPFHTIGPVSRAEFDGLRLEFDLFRQSAVHAVTRDRPEAVARMIDQATEKANE